uniref:Uncharacterized protein n=1 Tax=uncultured organism TaxID=155900 RepID=M1P153_9ZZZZ|nr:hypothetical protein FLSS-17_0004 [uncultured organism]
MIKAFTKLRKALDGKKTYISAAIFGLLGALKWYGIEIPTFTWPLLTAVGMGSTRAAIKKIPESE